MRRIFNLSRSKTWHVGISAASIAILGRSSDNASPTLIEEANPDQRPETVVEQFGRALDRLHGPTTAVGAAVEVILGSAWVRTYIVTPPVNAIKKSDLEAAAAMRFQAAFGELADDWQLEADWQLGRPFLVCAVPRRLVESLAITTKSRKLQLMRCQPGLVAAWNRWNPMCATGDWLAIAEQSYLSFVGVSDQRTIGFVRDINLTAEERNLDGVTTAIRRTAVQMGLQLPPTLHTVGLSTMLDGLPPAAALRNASGIRINQLDVHQTIGSVAATNLAWIGLAL